MFLLMNIKEERTTNNIFNVLQITYLMYIYTHYIIVRIMYKFSRNNLYDYVKINKLFCPLMDIPTNRKKKNRTKLPI